MEQRSESLGKLAVAKAKAHLKFKPIGKDRDVSVSTRAGGSYSYSYADLASCLDAVIPALSEEGLALFQPVRVEGETAIATTLLVHGESGEWLAGDYAAPVVDPKDARSVGSAATYARRYGLLSMLAIATMDDDDDGAAARGGQHEMAAPQGSRACPACGVVGSVMKDSKAGGWACWKSKGGCETKWESGPFPTAAPLDLMPRRREPSAPEQATAGAPGVASVPRGEVTTGAESSKKRGAKVGAVPMGDVEPCPSLGCLLDKGHTGHHVTARIPDVGMASEADDGPSTSGKLEFKIGPTTYVTNGLTEAQLLETFRLVPAVDRAHGKETARKMLKELFNLTSRTDLTQAQGEQFIRALYAKLPEQGA